ncbi:hypothetical protein FJT64_020836 [Amphibalanus amphitrite]|uniref:Uncharacterized protein n=1 Tax=Amphibalanus amphitrite TaxID=1232801 RepID=A0A6A4WKI5_AMPAM|nr:uncharacterized protein LOC122386676 [Amphibalanus amphitrite]KAF0307907.1 hypothetical protein FJT64_020836 [Amphibalanus amphitrite]
MAHLLLLLLALVSCSHASIILRLNTSAGEVVPQARFYLVALRPVALNITICSPPMPPTCDLNDPEASYVVQRAVRLSGHAHILLDGRTVRTEFALQAATGQLSAAAGRQAALDLSAEILANTSSPLLNRPLAPDELSLASLSIARNVPSCVRLTVPIVRDMWAGFAYRQAQQVNFTAADPIGQFVVASVLFLSRDERPVDRPDALKFSQFVRGRLAQLVGGSCTEVPAVPSPSSQLVAVQKERKVIQLVTVWTNGTVTVKEVTPAEVVQGVPFAPNGDGTLLVGRRIV